MNKVSLMLRSYADDFAYAERLVKSFNKHNADGLTLFIVVSHDEMELFSQLTSDHVVVLDDLPVAHYFTDSDINGIRPGYINQEIVKLAFWELGLSTNYFCIDSDAIILRDFTVEDFLASDGTPFSVLVEDRELLVEPRYYSKYWRSREISLSRIAEELSLGDRPLLTCHGHQVFSAEVLRSFRDNFLQPRGWSYLDALRVSPYEFTWYNYWLQKDQTIPINIREPLVKVFHHEGQHLEYLLRGIRSDDIARGYLAVVVNSNYSRDLGLLPITESKEASIARYLSYKELWTLTRIKIGRSFSTLLDRSSKES